MLGSERVHRGVREGTDVWGAGGGRDRGPGRHKRDKGFEDWMKLRHKVGGRERICQLWAESWTWSMRLLMVSIRIETGELSESRQRKITELEKTETEKLGWRESYGRGSAQVLRKGPD